jgi:hypothetical protein
MYGQFREDNATAQTADFSVSIPDKVSTEQLKTQGLEPPRAPELHLHNYYLWEATGR